MESPRTQFSALKEESSPHHNKRRMSTSLLMSRRSPSMSMQSQIMESPREDNEREPTLGDKKILLCYVCCNRFLPSSMVLHPSICLRNRKRVQQDLDGWMRTSPPKAPQVSLPTIDSDVAQFDEWNNAAKKAYLRSLPQCGQACNKRWISYEKLKMHKENCTLPMVSQVQKYGLTINHFERPPTGSSASMSQSRKSLSTSMSYMGSMDDLGGQRGSGKTKSNKKLPKYHEGDKVTPLKFLEMRGIKLDEDDLREAERDSSPYNRRKKMDRQDSLKPEELNKAFREETTKATLTMYAGGNDPETLFAAIKRPSKALQQGDEDRRNPSRWYGQDANDDEKQNNDQNLDNEGQMEAEMEGEMEEQVSQKPQKKQTLYDQHGRRIRQDGTRKNKVVKPKMVYREYEATDHPLFNDVTLYSQKFLRTIYHENTIAKQQAEEKKRQKSMRKRRKPRRKRKAVEDTGPIDYWGTGASSKPATTNNSPKSSTSQTDEFTDTVFSDVSFDEDEEEEDDYHMDHGDDEEDEYEQQDEVYEDIRQRKSHLAHQGSSRSLKSMGSRNPRKEMMIARQETSLSLVERSMVAKPVVTEEQKQKERQELEDKKRKAEQEERYGFVLKTEKAIDDSDSDNEFDYKPNVSFLYEREKSRDGEEEVEEKEKEKDNDEEQ